MVIVYIDLFGIDVQQIRQKAFLSTKAVLSVVNQAVVSKVIDEMVAYQLPDGLALDRR